MTAFDPSTYSEDVLRVARTAMAINGSGRDVDEEVLITDLMADYGWSRDEAEDHIEYAEYVGAIWFGRPAGTLLS